MKIMEKVTACIVTRGDHDLTPIYHSIADAGIGLIKIWDNSKRDTDLSVYGRYALIEETDSELIYVQDDDCVLPPESIQALLSIWTSTGIGQNSVVVSNMPQSFRHDFYSDHCLVGFGSVFHRDLPQRAFERLNVGMTWKGVCPPHWSGLVLFDTLNFRRTCDVVFTALTPRVLVDVPYENLPWATDESRMYRQNGHVGERTRMLELVRAVRDAG